MQDPITDPFIVSEFDPMELVGTKTPTERESVISLLRQIADSIEAGSGKYTLINLRVSRLSTKGYEIDSDVYPNYERLENQEIENWSDPVEIPDLVGIMESEFLEEEYSNFLDSAK